MAKAQWFKFYYEKFLLGTKNFSNAEVGAYLKLLIYQFDKGEIPTNNEEIEEITGSKVSKLTKVLKKFEINNEGKRINMRMSEVKTETDIFFERQASNGSKGGRPKKAQNPNVTQNNPVVSSGKPTVNPIRREEKRREEKDIIDDDDSVRENENSDDVILTFTPREIEPFQTISQCLEEFTNSPKYIHTRETLCVKYHLENAGVLAEKGAKFNIALVCQGVFEKQISDWIRHFNNWIPKGDMPPAKNQNSNGWRPTEPTRPAVKSAAEINRERANASNK